MTLFGDVNSATVLNVVSTLALVVSLIFASAQIRMAQRQRKRDTAVGLVQSFHTPEFVSGVAAMLELPDNLSKAELQSRFADKLDNILLMLLSLESVGILVQKREIPIDLADDFFYTPVVVGWQKLHRYIEDMRKEQGVDTPLEFFQFLVEQIARRQGTAPAVPAFIAYRDWRP
jgi:hypothetical protein